MKPLLIFSFLLCLNSCKSPEPYYYEDFYETISGINFPKSTFALESTNNEKVLITTAFSVDSLELRKLIIAQMFSKYYKDTVLNYNGSYLLKKYKPEFLGKNDLYYKSGEKEKNSWTYLIDINRQMLWAEILYPDWSGD